MTRLWNDPAVFADEMVDGFVAANGRYVQRVQGGVVRSTTSPAHQVAVVIGGGSGHYPAFGGLVGPGLAHGAAMGNLFASPSTQQILSVARAADNGGGVLFTYGNYAGDVLNFDAAQDRLRSEGIPCETVLVTDDISSAAPSERSRRRGIAGDLAVFRLAAAAAEEDRALDEVVRIAARANERTRSIGVAFSGCTLPGSPGPLFEVPEGRMAVGLGIHGEPGIDETGVPTADELGEMLVSRLFEELPEGVAARGARVVPILNGLGSVKYEEMFVVYRRVAELLDAAGTEIVDPHVGEYCTSFDMAGLSLTLVWLDDELEALWDTAVDTPAYRRGSMAPREHAGAAVADRAEKVAAASDVRGDHESRAVAGAICSASDAVVRVLDAEAGELGRLDAIAGDGDHGIGMQRGAHAAARAAAEAAAAGAGAATVLHRAADAWADRAGGTSGALWGLILSAVAEELRDAGTPAPADVVRGVASATRQVMAYGRAKPGDKTLVDALVPLSTVLSDEVEAGARLEDAWRAAAEAAVAAAAATADLLPRLGRARPHAEKSLGTPDPGAVSLALVATTLLDVFTRR